MSDIDPPELTPAEVQTAAHVDAMMAAPAKATAYRVMPGVVSNEDIPKLTGAFLAAGLSQGESSKLQLAKKFADYDERVGVNPDSVNRKNLEKLRTRWGTEFDGKLAIAQAEAKRLCDTSPILAQWLGKTAMGSNPAIVEMLHTRGAYRATKKG